VSGYTLSQGVQAIGYTTTGRNWRIRAALDASASRREDRLLGSFLGRSAQATAMAAWRTFSLELIAGETDGVSEPLVNPGVGGGLLLPSQYNTHTTFIGGTAGLVAGNFYFSAMARASLISVPDHPTVAGRTFIVAASYSLGKFILSLEDRYTDERSGQTQQAVNQVWLKLERTFDARF